MAQTELAVGLQKSRVKHRGQLADIAVRFSRNRLAVGALVIIFLIALAGVFADWVAPYGALDADTSAARQGPSLAHPFGTDEIGRDVFSRIIHAIGTTLPVGIVPVFIASSVGTTMGLLAGHFGGWVDAIIMRFVDILLAFPGILLAISIVTVLGVGLQNLMIAVGIGSIPLYSRIVRGATLSIKSSLYVEAATSIGASDARIMFRHVLPNVLAPLTVVMTLGAAGAILAASSLSFLGLGAQPPAPEWGAMLSSARKYLTVAWWMSVFPGLAITLVVLCFNQVGDALRDVLDPRLRT